MYMGILLVVEGMCLGAFSVVNMWLFYVCFECVLIPMYLLIVRFGSKNRRRRASSYLLVYTVGGSLCMLLSLGLLQYTVGSLDVNSVQSYVSSQEGFLL